MHEGYKSFTMVHHGRNSSPGNRNSSSRIAWISRHKLAEECEARIWQVIYDTHHRGLSYEIIDFVIEIIQDGIDTIKTIETED